MTSPPEENIACDEHITHSTLRRTIVTSAFPSIGRRFARSHQEYKEEDDEAFPPPPPPPPLDVKVVVVVVKVFSAESMMMMMMMYQPTAPSSSSSLLLRASFGELVLLGESLREGERKRVRLLGVLLRGVTVSYVRE